MAAITTIAQTLSISLSLIGAGGIATLSFFDVPMLRSQPAERSLPMIRWLFSRGSHVFPTASTTASAGFALLAYNALPRNLGSISQFIMTSTGMKSRGYVLAAVLAFSIGPFTGYMIPNNFALIKKNEEKGGARSVDAAKALRQSGYQPGQRSAEDSANSKGEGAEMTDRSLPQTKTPISTSQAENDEVDRMLAKFGAQNNVRALLLGAGGVVGLITALA